MSARDVVKALGGRWTGNYGSAPCPAHDDREPSLLVKDAPDGRGVFVHCFAGCAWQDVKAELERRGLLAAADRPGTGSAAHGVPARRPAAPVAPASSSPAALAIWREALPATGTPVESYMRRRGITIAIPPSIRYRPRLLHAPSGERFDAMVAGVQAGDGRIVAIHRTYLGPDGRKADVTPVKMMLGPVSGGAVRLAAAVDRLVVGEGIETLLAVMQATGRPAWAALSTSGLRSLQLPPSIRSVVIAADGDAPGEKAAEAAAQRWIDEGRAVRIARPPAGADFNDVLLGSAKLGEAINA